MHENGSKYRETSYQVSSNLLVRHKDVKSQNILLYHRNGITRIMFTDFGISFDFSTQENSMTEGPSPKTRTYYAPEVARNAARGRKSDVYSLGCVFLEIITILAAKDLDDLDAALGGDGIFSESQSEMASWMQYLL
jgi:serine/threonine protein kinase